MFEKILIKVSCGVNAENEPCKVIDCIINPEVCSEMSKKSDRDLLAFFRDLLTVYIFQKHRIQLSSEEFKLPKLKYKGQYVDFQRVRAKKQPKIEVVGQTRNPNSPEEAKAAEEAAKKLGKEAFQEPTTGVRKPDWKLKLINKDDEEVDFDGFNMNNIESKGLIVTFDLPALVTGKHINLQVSQNMLALACGRIYECKIKFPILLDPTATTSVFMTSTRQLRTHLQIVSPTSAAVDDELVQVQSTVHAEENILEKNKKKLNEMKLDFKTNLLTVLM